MIEHLQTRGFDRQQAYALCSVAVDLRISQTVDVPNLLVSALLPLDIFMWPRRLKPFECLLEVGDHILRVLDADREPDQVLPHPYLLPARG